LQRRTDGALSNPHDHPEGITIRHAKFGPDRFVLFKFAGARPVKSYVIVWESSVTLNFNPINHVKVTDAASSL